MEHREIQYSWAVDLDVAKNTIGKRIGPTAPPAVVRTEPTRRFKSTCAVPTTTQCRAQAYVFRTGNFAQLPGEFPEFGHSVRAGGAPFIR